MDQRGDPRIGEADVVDWVEHIPFRETRNYVMRVTESIPVYQARVSGQTGPIAFTALLIGEKIRVRPEARPLVRAEPESVVSTSNAPAALTGPATVPGIRPVARPGG